MFIHIAPYRYLLPNLYLSVADIANPDLFACGSRTWISLNIPRFYEENFQPSSGSALPACAHCWGREGSTQFVQGLPDRCDSSPACRLSFGASRLWSACFSIHQASSSITPAGSVHKSRGVCMWVQMKRLCMLCVCVSECYKGDIVVMDMIWRRLFVSMTSEKITYLFLTWARMRRMRWRCVQYLVISYCG